MVMIFLIPQHVGDSALSPNSQIGVPASILASPCEICGAGSSTALRDFSEDLDMLCLYHSTDVAYSFSYRRWCTILGIDEADKQHSDTNTHSHKLEGNIMRI